MEKLIIIFLISVIIGPLCFSDNLTISSYDRDGYDSFLIELIENKIPVIREEINPRDSLYRIEWSACFDLEGKRIEYFSEIFQIIVFPKYGKVFGVGNISEAKQCGLDSLYQKEQWRIHQYIVGVDVSKLIKNQSPCISNRLKSEGVIGLFFKYDILPPTNSTTITSSKTNTGLPISTN